MSNYLKYLTDRPLLSVNADAKTLKGSKLGVLTGILYLAPSDLSGANLCPKASEGCKKACLYTAGRGAFSTVQQARLEKTQAFLKERKLFEQKLIAEIYLLKARAKSLGLKPCVRLNGTSDIHFERIFKTVFIVHNDVQFYDYTKRVERILANKTPNLHLTFSRSESNEHECLELLKLGHNVAVVFDRLPEAWHGFKVIDGDLSDVRFMDEKGVVVGLTAKGKAKKDQTGFVVRN